MYPHCPKCGALTKIFVFGSPSDTTIVIECPKCGTVFKRENSISTLRDKV